MNGDAKLAATFWAFATFNRATCSCSSCVVRFTPRMSRKWVILLSEHRNEKLHHLKSEHRVGLNFQQLP
jgi:hypothetical protein